MEEAKKIKCYKRLIYKQFVQVSGLCGPQFLSYLSKRFTHLCRDLYGDAILVHRFGAPKYGRRKSTKTCEVHYFYNSSFFFTRELAYVRINISSNTWNGYTAENQDRGLFFNETTFLFGVTHWENSEVQIAVFSKWNTLREWELVQRFTFCLSLT